jgi:hypothetical protein
MPLRIKQMAVNALTPYERNANVHPESQIQQIADSITKYGFNIPITIDSEGGIIAGHGRYEAALLLKLAKVPTVRLDHMTEEEKRQFIIADNRIAQNSYWDKHILATELTLMDGSFDIMGFEDGEAETLILENIDTPAMPDDSTEGIDKGTLLALASVAIGEPRTEVHHGQHWKLGGSHDLLILSVISESQGWRDFLFDNSLFCPYPNPMTALSIKSQTHHLLLIQPDLYIAAHMLDQYEAIHGTGSVKLIQ